MTWSAFESIWSCFYAGPTYTNNGNILDVSHGVECLNMEKEYTVHV